MRRPNDVERLYLDFDGFFASVEQQCRPHLRGKPVGVIPFAEATNSCVIACSREAKLHGVKNVAAILAPSRHAAGSGDGQDHVLCHVGTIVLQVER